MGVVIRQSIKATIVSYIGAVIGALLVIYLYPKTLTPEQIGLTRVLNESALLFCFFAQIGMSSVAIKFFPYFIDASNDDNGFTFFIFFVPLVGFIFFIFLFHIFQNGIVSLFSQNSGLFTHYLLFVIPLTFFNIYTAIAETYASLLQRIVVPKFIKEVLIRILTIILVIVFYYNTISLDQFVILFTLIYAIGAILNLLYLNSIKRLNFKPNFHHIRGPLKREILWFMLYMMVVGVGSIVSSRIDVFMLGNKMSLSGIGIFTIAYFIASFIEMPSRAIFQMVTPFTSDALKNNDIKLIDSLYKRTSINQLIVAGLLFLLLWINADNIFKIMPNGDIFKAGKYVILFIGLAKVFDALTGINAIILGNSKFYYYTLFFIFFLAIITFAVNFYFIPIWGIVGSALATCISVVLYNLILVIFVKWKIGVQPFTKDTFTALILLGLTYSCSLIIPNLSDPIINIFIRSLIISTVFIFTIYRFNVSDDINNVIQIGMHKVLTLIKR
jgi:O-antigen/teichoic acid export membrane protein